MPIYRKKPVEVEAFRLGYDDPPEWFKEYQNTPGIAILVYKPYSVSKVMGFSYQGILEQCNGSWIVKASYEEGLSLYSDAEFRANFEPVEEPLTPITKPVMRCG